MTNPLISNRRSRKSCSWGHVRDAGGLVQSPCEQAGACEPAPTVVAAAAFLNTVHRDPARTLGVTVSLVTCPPGGRALPQGRGPGARRPRRWCHPPHSGVHTGPHLARPRAPLFPPHLSTCRVVKPCSSCCLGGPTPEIQPRARVAAIVLCAASAPALGHSAAATPGLLSGPPPCRAKGSGSSAVT